MYNLVTKENFISYINKLEKLNNEEIKLNENGILFNFNISFEWHEQLIIDILTDIFDDNSFNWISYFIYQLSFGRDWHEGCITINGTDIPLKDAGDLYDLLISEMNR